jgi:hypothetical protein
MQRRSGMLIISINDIFKQTNKKVFYFDVLMAADDVI